MRGFVILLSILLISLGGLTVWCNEAKATPSTNEQQYLDTVRAAGFDKPDAAALRDGYIICAADSQPGVNDDLIQRGINAAQRFLGSPDKPELDAAVTDAAQKFLCPSTVSENTP